jgi:hypothetical protein
MIFAVVDFKIHLNELYTLHAHFPVQGLDFLNGSFDAGGYLNEKPSCHKFRPAGAPALIGSQPPSRTRSSMISHPYP